MPALEPQPVLAPNLVPWASHGSIDGALVIDGRSRASLLNHDVIDLYERVPLGMRVVVLPESAAFTS